MKKLIEGVWVNQNYHIAVLNYDMVPQKNKDGKFFFIGDSSEIAKHKGLAQSVDLYVEDETHTSAIVVRISASSIQKLHQAILEAEAIYQDLSIH